MPDDIAKKRVLSWRTQISALKILQAKKSQIVIKSALWGNIYQAQLEVARQERRIAELDEARRQIIIVAVTGIASCVGAFAVTTLLARSAGVAYTSFSMAAPVYTATSTVGLPTGTTIAVTASRTLAPTLAQWIKGQIAKTLVIGVPVGLLLKRFVGDSALTMIIELIGHKAGAVPFSDEEFKKMRDEFARSGIGDERFQRVIRDPNARREQIVPVMREQLKEMTAQHIAEALIGVEAPANGLLLMNDLEFANWYRAFRNDVDAYIGRTYGSWSREDRNILRNTLFWHFWNDVKNQLNALDQRWHNNVRLLEKAIRDEEISMRMLFGGQTRAR